MVVLVAARRVGSLSLRYWQIMAAGAIAMLAVRALTPREAVAAIDLDVMLFLFGVFVIARPAEVSGELEAWSYRLFRHARSADHLVLLILFGLGSASALLMNDAFAIVGTPVVIALARAHRMPERTVLLALAFAVTIGSVPSPIGNPQNLLVGLSEGLDNAFLAFAKALLLPTVINLLLAYFLLRLLEPAAFHCDLLVHQHSGAGSCPGSCSACRPRLTCDAGRRAHRARGRWRRHRTAARRDRACARDPRARAQPAILVLAAGSDWPTLASFVGLFVLVGWVSASGLSSEALEQPGSGAT